MSVHRDPRRDAARRRLAPPRVRERSRQRSRISPSGSRPLASITWSPTTTCWARARWPSTPPPRALRPTARVPRAVRAVRLPRRHHRVGRARGRRPRGAAAPDRAGRQAGGRGAGALGRSSTSRSGDRLEPRRVRVARSRLPAAGGGARRAGPRPARAVGRPLVSFDGRFHRLDGSDPPTPRPSHPGVVRRLHGAALRRSAAHGDGISSATSARRLDAARTLRELLAAADRSTAEFGMEAIVDVTGDPGAVLEAAGQSPATSGERTSDPHDRPDGRPGPRGSFGRRAPRAPRTGAPRPPRRSGVTRAAGRSSDTSATGRHGDGM